MSASEISLFWVILILLILCPFLIRAWMRWTGRGFKTGGYVLQKPSDLPGEKVVTIPPLPVERVIMRNRYMPERKDIRSALTLADQIIADQQAAHETPGRPVGAPAPGEPGYMAPSSRLRVSAGPYTVILRRDGPALLVESNPGGSEYPAVVIPGEWSEVISAFAFEVQRLRDQ